MYTKEENIFERHDGMKKGDDYTVLKKAGLPIPLYGVFDSSCLTAETSKAALRNCVECILTEGSGLIGVRTEPKEVLSALGDYPHYMPLRTFEEVTEAITCNEREWPQNHWWYLVNEAFLEYELNAVVILTQEGSLPGHWRLDGDVNVTDNLPLRLALANSVNLIRANKWTGSDAAQVRKRILRSGLFETWLEISKVRTPSGQRLVFWGMRGSSHK
jgi:hypothetical protein